VILVGVPVTGVGAVFLSLNALFVETVLQVGTYERVIIGDDRQSDNWRRCAQSIVAELTVWVTANRDRLPRDRQ